MNMSLQREPENAILQQKLKLEFNVGSLTYVLSLPTDSWNCNAFLA